MVLGWRADLQTSKVTCDTCGCDLTTTGNSVDYRIAVVVENIRPESGSVTDMMAYPPLERMHHFCGKPCLKKWAAKLG